MNAVILILCLAGLWIYIGSHRTDDVVVAWVRFFTGICLLYTSPSPRDRG